MPLSCGPSAPGPLAQSARVDAGELEADFDLAPVSGEASLASLLSSASMTRGLDSLALSAPVARAARLGSFADRGTPAMPPQATAPLSPVGSRNLALRQAPPPERDLALHRRLATTPRERAAGDDVLATAEYQGRLLPLPPAGAPLAQQPRLGRLVPLSTRSPRRPSPRFSPRATPPSARGRLLQQVHTSRLLTLRGRLKSMSYGMGRGQNPWALFSRYDRDNDGLLTLVDFTNAVRKDGGMNEATLSNKELVILFKTIDVDKSGHIDIQELTSFVWGEGGREGEEATKPTSLARSGSSTLAGWRSTSVPVVRVRQSPRGPATPRSGAVAPIKHTKVDSPLTREPLKYVVSPMWSTHALPYAQMVEAGSYAFWFGKTGDPFVKQLPGSSFATLQTH